MNKMLHLAAVSAALLVLSLSSAARADVIFNNFGTGDTFPDSGRIVQGEAVNNIGNVDQAVGFTVPASNNYDLTDIRIGIGVFSSPFNGEGPLDIILAADSGGLPGAALKTFSLNINSTGEQIAHASGGATLQLNAGTQYWVIADGKTTFDGGWEFNPIGDMGPTAGRSDNGPWNLHVDDKTRMALRVEGRAIPSPEPASVVLLAMGAIGLVTLCGRRNLASAC
jgi:hypothetical protein